MLEGPAGSLFAEFLSLRESDARCDLDEFCRRHPREADALRALYADYLLIERARQNAATLLDDGPAFFSTVQVHGQETNQAWQVLLDRLKERGPTHRRYRIEGERIGRGGMGEVFRAVDVDTLRVVALKRIRPDLIKPESDGEYRRLRARFLEEAQIHAQLDHPGIVPVHEMGVDPDGRVFFTMKFVKGESFKAFLRNVALGFPDHSLTRAVSILLEVSETVAFAHSKGVIHRDLKPENIMLGAYGETFVMDWGLAKLLSHADSDQIQTPSESNIKTSATQELDDSARATLTGQDQQLGTPYYMSPEQAAGERARIGPATDIYAAGAILYTALAGEPPYHDSSTPKSAFQVINEVRLGPPPPISRVAPNAPQDLVAICERAMARRPEQRYTTMLDFANDLRAYLENRVVSAHVAGTWNQLRKWVLRNRLTFLAAAGTFVALIGTGFWWIEYRNRRALESEQQKTETALAEETRSKQRADVESQRAIIAEQQARNDASEAENQRVIAESKSEEAARAREAAELARTQERAEREKAEAAAAAAHEEKTRAEAATVEKERLRQQAEEARRDAELANRKIEEQEIEVVSLLIRTRRLQSEELIRNAESLWPPKIRFLEAYDSWIREADLVLSDRDQIVRRLPKLSADSQREAAELFALLDRISSDDLYAPTRHSIEWRKSRAATLADFQAARAREWESVLTQIADVKKSPIYRGLRISIQDELVPVSTNPNPTTRCFEFYSPLSGLPPIREADGSYQTDANSAAVFVLIPSGQCIVGRQNLFEERRNYSIEARPIELPRSLAPNDVSAFFVSRRLITRAQLDRMIDQGISNRSPPGEAESPAVGIAWDEASYYARTWGMTLPSELQWEYLTRASSPSIDEVWRHSLVGLQQRWSQRTERAWGLADFESGPAEWVHASHELYFGSGSFRSKLVIEDADTSVNASPDSTPHDLIEAPSEYFAELEISDSGELRAPGDALADSDPTSRSAMTRYRRTWTLYQQSPGVAISSFQVCRGGTLAVKSGSGYGLRDFRSGAVGFEDCGFRLMIEPERP